MPTTPVKMTEATAMVVMPPRSWVTVMAIGVVMDLVVSDNKVSWFAPNNQAMINAEADANIAPTVTVMSSGPAIFLNKCSCR